MPRSIHLEHAKLSCHIAFLTANSQRWTSIIDDKEQYGLLFRTSLRLEVALFNSGYEKV